MPSLREWWSFGAAVYLPSMLFGIGQGAVIPVVVITSRELGSSLSTASLVVAMMAIGKIVGDVPAGALAEHLGERMAMLVASVLTVLALLVCVFAQSLIVFTCGIVALGAGSAVWGLARHTYLAEVMPPHLRGRALSTLGGTQRIGLFLGPFLGAAAIGPLGLRGAYWIHIATAVVATMTLFFVPDAPRHRDRASAQAPESTVAIVRAHLPVLRTLGVGAMMISAVRGSRQVIIPLWADHLHLAPATTSIIFGIAGALDVLLFYPSGLAMDRWGRRPLIVSSMIGLGIAHAVLPFATTAVSLAGAACLMGLGNGLSAGANMTVGADASPAVGRAAFLGAWRLLSDIGTGLGPLAVGSLTAATALAPAALVMGVAAGATAVMMNHWLPRGTATS
jgi:MFS family permease